MGRKTLQIITNVREILTKILTAEGVSVNFHHTTHVRTDNTSRPYREIRVYNDTLWEMYNDPFYKKLLGENIGEYIQRMVPGVISVTSKQYTPSNEVLDHNNVVYGGLLIHVEL